MTARTTRYWGYVGGYVGGYEEFSVRIFDKLAATKIQIASSGPAVFKVICSCCIDSELRKQRRGDNG